MKRNILLSVVAVINDDASLPSFLSDLSPVLRECVENYEIIVVGNGLTQLELNKAKTEILLHKCIRLLLLSEDHPVDIAFTAGIDNSIGDFVIMMDSYTDPAPVIPRLLEVAESGCDVVIASSGGKRYSSLLSRLGGAAYFKLARLMLPQASDIDPSYFTCFSRKALNALAQNKDAVRSYRFLRSQLGFSRQIILYEPIRRPAKARRRDSVLLMWLSVESLFSYSMVPLRFFSAISFLLGGISYMSIPYAFLSWLLNPKVVGGWASTSIMFGFMFGSIFVLLGIFGLYFGILLKEIKKVPLYHIVDELDTGSAISDYQKKNVV